MFCTSAEYKYVSMQANEPHQDKDSKDKEKEPNKDNQQKKEKKDKKREKEKEKGRQHHKKAVCTSFHTFAQF